MTGHRPTYSARICVGLAGLILAAMAVVWAPRFIGGSW